MPRKVITWQNRGQYLAECLCMTPQAFAAALDRAMEQRQGSASTPASANATGAGRKTATRKGAREKQPAGAGT